MLFHANDSECCAARPRLTEAARDCRRRKLWDIAPAYHCAIIGTCLPMPELRRIARRSGVERSETLCDYDLHHAAVNTTCRRNALSELAHKALDARYAAAVRAFAQARSDSDIESRWNEALARGEVAGALWAVMSHPWASPELCDRVSHEVHMLSHQVGAASRADLRRLAELERESRELRELLQRQAQRSAAKLAEKDRQLAELERAVRERDARLQRLAAVSPAPAPESACAAAARAANAEVRVRELAAALKASVVRCAELENALAHTQRARDAAEEALRPTGSDSAADDVIDNNARAVDLCGRRLLCVGGRANVIDHCRDLVERWNGRFEHHDGGLEHNPQRLHALLAAADAVVCAAGHLNHGAYYVVKRYCKRRGKPCVLLKNDSVSSFVRGIRALAGMPCEAGAGDTVLVGARC